MAAAPTRPLPLLTAAVVAQLRAAVTGGTVSCSLDLARSVSDVVVSDTGFRWEGHEYPWPAPCRDRTVYYWNGSGFEPAARYEGALVKLAPTDWGPPTFEIDGIKMLPTAQVSPWADAQRKAGLVAPGGRRVLDCCGGLGYFAAACLAAGAVHVESFEKSAAVAWLRSLNPWSPDAGGALSLALADVTERIRALPAASFDAVLHDPPRFGIAGELYSQAFYDELARVLRPGGRLFHYTGTPNRLTSNRDVPREVSRRLQRAGFETRPEGDGVFGVRGGTARGHGPRRG